MHLLEANNSVYGMLFLRFFFFPPYWVADGERFTTFTRLCLLGITSFKDPGTSVDRMERKRYGNG